MGDKGLPDSLTLQSAMNDLSISTGNQAASASTAGQNRIVDSYVNLQQHQQHMAGADRESNEIRQNNWREVEGSNRRKWEYALEHGLFSDLVFHIGRNREPIKAHTLIFNLQSSKFAEKYPKGDCKTEFDWIEPEAFRHFLKFLYTESINVGIEDALWVLIIANYFEIGKLVHICEEKIKKDLNVGNAAFVYQKGHDYECTKLESLAKEFIIKHAAHVFETDGILQLTNASIGAILESPARKINEVQAFQAILRWAKAQYIREQYGDLNDAMGVPLQMPEPDWTAENVTRDLQHILKSIIGHINFREFTNLEFAQYVVPSEILSYKEAAQILTELTLGAQNNGSSSKSILPLNIPSNMYTLERYLGPIVEAYWRDEDGTDKISFKVNKPIAILGFGLFGTSEGVNEPAIVKASITDYDEANVLGMTANEIVLPNPAGLFELQFEEPVQIKPGEWHTIRVTMSQVKPYGISGRKKYEVEVGDGGKMVWEFMNAKGIAGYSVGRGQIPKIMFSA